MFMFLKTKASKALRASETTAVDVFMLKPKPRKCCGDGIGSECGELGCAKVTCVRTALLLATT